MEVHFSKDLKSHADHMFPLVLALVPLQNVLINLEIFQWKCPLFKMRIALPSQMKFQDWHKKNRTQSPHLPTVLMPKS